MPKTSRLRNLGKGEQPSLKPLLESADHKETRAAHPLEHACSSPPLSLILLAFVLLPIKENSFLLTFEVLADLVLTTFSLVL